MQSMIRRRRLSLSREDEKQLNTRQKLFVAEYAVSLNGWKAAKVAGYKGSVASLKCAATRLMKDKYVAKAIQSVVVARQQECTIKHEDIIKQLNCCLTRNCKMLFDKNGVLLFNSSVINGEPQGSTVQELPDEIINSIDGIKQRVKRYTRKRVDYIEVETELRLVPKSAAIDMAMRHKGMYAPDKVDMNAKVASLDITQLYRAPSRNGDAIEQAILDVQSVAEAE